MIDIITHQRKADQDHNETNILPHQIASYKDPHTPSTDKDLEQMSFLEGD